MKTQTTDHRVSEFSRLVQTEFAFLEADYGLLRQPLELADEQYPPDSRASIAYLGGRVGVEIVLGLGDDSISVVFYETEGGHKPEQLSFYADGVGAKAARLETILQLLIGEAFSPPLPEIVPGLSVAEMVRRSELRSKLVRSELRAVLSSYADLVCRYCGAILQGDTSRFAEFQHSHSDRWRWA